MPGGGKWAPCSDFACAPRLEPLENRILFSVNTLLTATPLSFTAFHNAHAGGFLATSNEVGLYAIQLGKDDELTANVSAQATGSGLASLLRVFGSTGTPLALDDQEGGDPHLSFQAPVPGTYYLAFSNRMSAARQASVREGRSELLGPRGRQKQRC